MWVEIKGYRWPYRINEEGQVEKKDDNTWRRLHPFVSGRTRACVKMQTKDHKKVDVAVKTLMANAFMGGRGPGECIVSINRSKMDCSLVNLRKVSRAESARMSCRNRRKPVVKVDREGNIVAVYSSMGEAAKKNYLSKTAIYHRCKGKVKDPFSMDGYNYQYEK